MPSKLLCDPYLWESPKVILYTPIFPADYTRCVSERINHVILVFILFMAVAAAVQSKFDSQIPLIIGGLLALLVSGQSMLVVLYILTKRVEGFQESGSTPSDAFSPNVDVIGKKNSGIESLPTECLGATASAYECSAKATQPSSRNPFMNVLIDELKYNPTRPAAASVLDPTVRLNLDEFFKTEFYSDPTDVFGKNQGQRQWVTMPSTSIPNDVDSYQNWLYKIPGKTCKEGGSCLPGTDGAVIPWLNVDNTVIGSDAIDTAVINRYPSPYNGNDNGSNSPQLLAAAEQGKQKYATTT